LGEATYFLEVEVIWDREARTLKQTLKKLARKLLARYEMEAAKGKSVPMRPGEKTVREGEPLNWETFPYNELVGSLLYLSVCTRSDIAQAVGVTVHPVHVGANECALESGTWGVTLLGHDGYMWVDLWEWGPGAKSLL
jgi:hypothetical protein